MTEHVFKDWMEAPTASGAPTSQEAAIIKDYVTCKDEINEHAYKDIGLLPNSSGPWCLSLAKSIARYGPLS